MHQRVFELVGLACLLVSAGCSEASESVAEVTDRGDEPQADTKSARSGVDAGAEDSETGSSPIIAPGERRLLAKGNGIVIGLASEDRAVYRQDGKVFVTGLGEAELAEVVTNNAGVVKIDGPLVYNWADADWDNNVGDLTIHSSKSGSRHMGMATLAEDRIQASADGEFVAFPSGSVTADAGATSGSFDVVVAATDLEREWTTVEGIAHGDMETCRAHYDFAGRDLYVAWCNAGSRSATLERYRLVDGEWQGEELANDIQPSWVLDGNSGQLMVITTSSQAVLLRDGRSMTIDNGVTWAQFVNDGSEALYTVGDQLRRTSLDKIDPVPIVTRDFRNREAFDSDYSHVLYSTTVTYEDGKRSDLSISSTERYNPEPVKLVGAPQAVLPRTGFSTNGAFAMYLTNMQDEGSLHLRPTGDGEERVIEGVVSAVAAGDDRIVYSANISEPDAYPIVTDLYILQTMSKKPQLLQERIADGHSFFVTNSMNAVVYSYIPEADDEVNEAGVYVRALE